MGRAIVEIWDPDNEELLAEAFTLDPELNQRNIDDLQPTGSKLNESGSGGIVLQEDHPAAEHVVPGNVVRVHSGDDLVYAFTIRERDHVKVAKVHKDRTITITGDDLLERWADSTVDPWLPGRPVSIDRVWNWAAPRGFDDSSWSTTIYFQTRTEAPRWPEAYPIHPTYAGQVWTRASHPTSQPLGSTLWRRTVTIDDDADVAVFQSADDAAHMWSDGVCLNRHSIVYPDKSGWQKCWREVPPWSAGQHTVAFEAFNFGGPAFFLSSGFIVDNGVIGEAIFSTGDGLWRWLDYPTEKPGFTAPEILDMLLDEAQDRGELLGWTIQVHGTHPNIEEFSCRIGTTYREVLTQLSELWCDLAADDAGLVLHIWPKGDIGTVTSVDIGDDAITVLQQIDDDDMCNAVQGVWSDGSRRRTRSPHPVLGMKTRSLQLGSMTDQNAVDKLLDLYLDAHEEPAPSIVGEIEDLVDAVAGVDYRTGDTLVLAGDSIVVTGISWTVDQVTGELVPHPEFNSLTAVRRAELLRAVDRVSAQFESGAAASVLSSKPLLVSGHPQTSEFTWSWADDIEDALNEVDPEKPWQIKRTTTIQRLSKLTVEIDVDDLPDAWGDTTVQLWKNDGPLNWSWEFGYEVTLTTTVAKAEYLLWAYEVVTPDDAIRVACSNVGGHVDGTITLETAEPV